jgi:glutamyl-Q tRNA(Asp) synthetase
MACADAPTGACAGPVQLGRFAPSTTGSAHPGTMMAALLCWLDARSRTGSVLLRLEDLDPLRCTPAFAAAMIDDLAWLGLDWDGVVWQHARADDHAAALDLLHLQGRLYPSSVGRSALVALGRRTPDGGPWYDNRDRHRRLPVGGWRACNEPIRVRLDDGEIAPIDEGGYPLRQDPGAAFGDPVVRRRDGAVAYQLAVVVDDAASAVTRVVRGRDIAANSATQVALQRLLGYPAVIYRHHAVLLEKRGRKLAKLHGSIGMPVLRQHYTPTGLCGLLAFLSGLRPDADACTPRDLLSGFSWENVRSDDLLVQWTGQTLSIGEVA